MSNKSAWVFDVTEAEFEEKVVKKSHEVPIVIDFWAPWCGPCRALAPLLEAMVETRAGAVLLAKVNTDDEQGLAAQFGISGIPHVVAYRKGKPFLQFTGLLADAQLADFFDRLQPTEAEKKIETAVSLEKSNPTEAEQMYRVALQANPNLEDAIVGLARVLIHQNKNQDAADVLQQIGSGGEYGMEADKLRAMLWLRDQAKDLPDEEMLHNKLSTNPKDAQARFELGCMLAVNDDFADALESFYQAGLLDAKLATSRVKEAMVRIFSIVGVRSELSDTYRQKLTSLLY